MAVLIATPIFLPHVVWQIQHDWPTVEFVQNAKRYKIADLTPGASLSCQLLGLGPANLPVWLIGQLSLLLARGARHVRLFGWIFLASVAFLVVQKSKPYYLLRSDPILSAAAAVALAGVVHYGRFPARTPVSHVQSAGVGD